MQKFTEDPPEKNSFPRIPPGLSAWGNAQVAHKTATGAFARVEPSGKGFTRIGNAGIAFLIGGAVVTLAILAVFHFALN